MQKYYEINIFHNTLGSKFMLILIKLRKSKSDLKNVCLCVKKFRNDERIVNAHVIFYFFIFSNCIHL